MPEPMLIVTQVAPYADGPAGVHGVLGQATMAELPLQNPLALVQNRSSRARSV